MFRAALAALALLSVASAASCGDDGAGTIEETDAVTGTSGTSTPDGYPPGPYGADVGETIPNLAWLGFQGEGAPYEAYALDDARRSGKRYALVHFGAVF